MEKRIEAPDWMKRRLSERKDLTDGYPERQRVASACFEQLKAIIVQWIDAYNLSKHSDRIMAGIVDGRLTITREQSSKPPRKLDLELETTQSGSTISVRRDDARSAPTFVCDVSDIVVPRLLLESRVISIEEAAERILDPFLFADLPQVYTSEAKKP